MSPEALILDFDGVILESNAVKDEAFKFTFQKYPEHVNTIMAYHASTSGLIRFDKFCHIAGEILNIPYTKKQEQQWSTVFADYVLKAIITCPFVKGAEEFLEYYFSRVPLFVVSINPSKDLAWTMEQRQLKKYFKKVYATPDKAGAIHEIIKQGSYSKERLFFIGDTTTDYQAAVTCGIQFIGRQSGSWPTPMPFKIFLNLKEIKDFLCHSEK